MTGTDEVTAFEREHWLTHVVVDEPAGLFSSIPAVWEVTAPKLAIFRLHGRNAETWDKKAIYPSSEALRLRIPGARAAGSSSRQCAAWRNRPSMST